MYKLKQIPEDFLVREISTVTFSDAGKYLYFLLRKKNWNTMDVIKRLASILGVAEKKIGFAGSKDKNAVTEQVCSVEGVSKDRLLGVKLNDVAFDFLGYGDVPISLGDLNGNDFEIVIRNFNEEKIEKVSSVENYFDEQRMSTSNVAIGRALVRKDFASAVTLIDDALVFRHLEEKKNDFVGALKKIPIRLLRLYVNAYQSYLWNETLAAYLLAKGEVLKEVDYSLGKFFFVRDSTSLVDLEVPIIGFGSEDVLVDPIMKKIIEDLMVKEGIDYYDFVIKQIPELTLEGEFRKAFVKVENLKIDVKEKDDRNKGKKKVMVTFSLGKGSYATMVVKRIVKII